MPIMFNTVIQEAGIQSKSVRLIRHKDKRAKQGLTPYELWRDDRHQFEVYQSVQNIFYRKQMKAPYWAVFIVNLNEETMFAGLYAVYYKGLLRQDTIAPHTGKVDKAGKYDEYELKPQDELSDLIGKLFIDWGPGTRSWVQYASRQNKPVTELRSSFQEPEFPG